MTVVLLHRKRCQACSLNSFLFISNSLRFHFYSQSQNRKLYFLCAKSDEFRRPIFWANVIDATLIVIPTLLALWAFVNGWKLSFSLGKWKRATDQSENHIEPQKHEPHSNGMRSYELTIFEWNELRGHRASSDALIYTQFGDLLCQPFIIRRCRRRKCTYRK